MTLPTPDAPIRGMPLEEFAGAHDGWTKARFVSAYPWPFLIVETADPKAAEKMFRTDPVKAAKMAKGGSGTTTLSAFKAPIELLKEDAAAPPRYFLYEIRRGPEVRPFPHITLGRTPQNDIVLVSPLVSKCHAIFKVDSAGRVALIDAASTNGTRLNEVPLKPHEPRFLRDGDHIRFANAYSAEFYSPEAFYDFLTVRTARAKR